MGDTQSVKMPDGRYPVTEVLAKPRHHDLNANRRWFGVCTYVIFSRGQAMYIGMSNYGPRTRLKQHRAAGRKELKNLLRQPETVVDVEFHRDRNKALVREHQLILELEPELNRRW